MEIRAGNTRTLRILQASVDGDIAFLECVEGKSLIEARCSSGCTALHWAAGTNQMEVVQYLTGKRSVCVDIPATKKARGRTPLHYACRNGCLEVAKLLVELGASVDERAKHGVSPFQLAVWQNHLGICEWLVEEQEVDPSQVNAFDCGAVHWLGICPVARADYNSEMNDGSGLLPMAKWLARHASVDFRMRQRQGHTVMHKAGGSHIALIRYVRDEHGLLDNVQDYAGNYAADLADMANTPRHTEVAQFLREECSAARAKSCAVLEVPMGSSPSEIRKAYLSKAKQVHPDRCDDDTRTAFDELRKAYEHLTIENGNGAQCNPAHSLDLMLEVSGKTLEVSKDPERLIDSNDCFKARLVAVLLEYGDKGLDLSNLKKKWKQVWPDTPFPTEEKIRSDKGGNTKNLALSDFIQRNAGDVVHLVYDEKHSIRIVPKHCTQGKVARMALDKDRG